MSLTNESEIDRKARRLREIREILTKQGILSPADAKARQEKEKAEAAVEPLPLRCCGTYDRVKHRIMCPRADLRSKPEVRKGFNSAGIEL